MSAIGINIKQFLFFIACFCPIIFLSQVPTAGLVGAWPFSGNANDVSGSNNNGTVFGATLTYDRCGNPNSAYSFNGTSDYIVMLATGPTGTVSRSVSFWAKTANTTIWAPRVSFDYGLNSGNGDTYQVVWNYCGPGVGLDLSNQASIYGDACILDNRWHHIAVVYNATVSTVYTTVSFYIDGVLQPGLSCNVSGTTASINTGTTYPVTIGRGVTPVRYWPGELDDFYLYNRPLTQTEVLQLYTACPPTIFGNTVVCQGSVNVYSVAPITGASYTWSLPGSWSGTSSTNTIAATASTASGIISVAMSSSCGIIGTSTLAVTTVTAPTVTVNSAPSVICAGGTVTLTASGATSYTWMNNGVVSPFITAILNTSVVYTIAAVAAGGCSTTSLYSPSVTPQPTVSAVASGSLMCNGGTATLTASGAAAYTWQPGNLGGLVAVVSPTANTVYTVTGLNAGGCYSTATVSVAVPSTLSLVTSQSATSVCLGSSITFTAAASGGIPGYTYSWTAGPSTNTFTAQQGIGGNYVHTITATDANNCAITRTATSTFYSGVVLASSNISVCSGSTATLVVSGAATYTWLPGGSTGNTFTFVPTVSTIYTVTGTSVNGCTASTTASITLQPTVALSFNSYTINCANLGSATVTASGGLGPYSYTWQPTAQTNSIASGLYPGTYSITVFDAGYSCKSVSTVTFAPTVPLTGTVSASSSVTCFGNTTGTANISLSGGSGKQFYLWTNPLGNQTTPITTGLGAGIHTVTVTDSLTFCQVTHTFQITQPPALTLIVSPPSASVCLGGSISFIASALGGVPGYSYQWLGGPSGSVRTVTQPLSGSYIYSVTAVDSKACLATATVGANFVSPPVVVTRDTSTCAGSPVPLSASGATSYTWFPGGFGGSTFVVFPVINSSYTVIGSALGCTAAAVASVTANPLPSAGPIANNGPVCEQSPITFTHNSAGASTFSWTGPAGFSSSVPNPVIAGAVPVHAGIYSLLAKTAFGCAITLTSNVVIIPLPVISASGATVCAGESATLTASGGTGYLWSGPQGFTSGSSNPVFAAVSSSMAGMYTVAVTGSNSCVRSANVPLVVNPFPLPVPFITSPKNACVNMPVKLSGQGGLTYTWTGPNGFWDAGATISFTPTSLAFSGTYTLTVKNASNCVSSATLPIIVYPQPSASISSSSNGLCVPFCTEIKVKASPGLTAPVIQFYLANSYSYFSDSVKAYCLNVPGNHTIQVLCADTNNCVYTATLLVAAFPKPKAAFDYAPEQPLSGIDPVKFNNLTIDGYQPQYAWYFGSNDIKSKEADPVYVFEQASNYPVVLVASNNFGCRDTLIKYIVVNDELSLYVPNAFTPDGDELNDVFQPKGVGIVSYSLDIFDRWGEKLFHTTDAYTGWNGSFKGAACKSDSYVWFIKISDYKGRIKTYNGSVTLVR